MSKQIHLHLATAIASLTAALHAIQSDGAEPASIDTNVSTTPGGDTTTTTVKRTRGPNKEKTTDPAPPVEQPKAPTEQPPVVQNAKTVADNPEAWNEAKMLAKPLIENKKQLLVRDLVTKHGGDKIISSIPLENLEAFKAEVTSEVEKAGLKANEEY